MRISDWSSDVCSSDLYGTKVFVRELATFERAPDAVEATEAMLAEALFGVHPAAEAVLATRDGTSLGFALFFHNFSTWTGRRGLYLEDLYVTRSEEHTSELQSLMRISYAGFCLKKKKHKQ